MINPDSSEISDDGPDNLDDIYKGSFKDLDWSVTRNGESFSHEDSLAVRNHSPDGFSWGYSGSGPSQLALAILLQETDVETAERLYPAFRDDVVINWPMESDWELTSQEVEDFLVCSMQ